MNPRLTKERAESGFSLVELMIALVIGAVLMVGVATLMANYGKDVARTHAEMSLRDDISVAMELIANDVVLAGRGVPYEALALRELEMRQRGIQRYASLVDLLEGRLVGGNNDAVDGRDELFLAGVGMDVGPAARRMLLVADDDETVGTNNAFTVFSPGVPSPLGFPRVGDRVVIASAAGLDAGSLEIADIESLGPGRWEVQLAGGALPPNFEVRRNQEVHVTRQNAVLSGVRYQLDENENRLERIFFPDATVDDGRMVPVLDNVHGFKVAFLVWPCGADAPRWMNDVDAFLADGTSFDQTNTVRARADRILTLAERLIAVRVSLILRDERMARQRGFDVTRIGDDGVDVEDWNFDPGSEEGGYYLVQQVIDPANLRFHEPMRPRMAGAIRSERQDRMTREGGLCQPHPRPLSGEEA